MSRIFETQDGSHSIFSEKFGVPYHSKYGAIQETEHVFINAALAYKAVTQNELSILDIGFGTGLNSLMTYLYAKQRNLKINYVGIEAFPISEDEVANLNYPKELNIHPEEFFKFHHANWGEPTFITEHFKLEKVQGKFQNLTYQGNFDIIYFDAFAPNAQPELWEESLLQKMYKALKEGGVLVTYCAKGVVKRTLKSVGFTVEALKGPPGKREMTRALKK